MFKILFVLGCILLLLSSAYAAIYLVEPLDKRLVSEDEVSFGKIAGGETLKVVVKKKNDLVTEWNSIAIDPQFMPAGWALENIESDKTLIAMVTLPKDALVSTQRLRFELSDKSQSLFSESFYATVSVNQELLTASMQTPSLEAVMGETANFNLVLNNDSIAEHSLRVGSSLPNYWFSARTVQLKPHETRSVKLPVLPYYYGEKNFHFFVSSLQNNQEFSFPAKVNAKPTLTGMYRASIAGFPFFSPSMLTYYLVNGFLSLVS